MDVPDRNTPAIHIFDDIRFLVRICRDQMDNYITGESNSLVLSGQNVFLRRFRITFVLHRQLV